MGFDVEKWAETHNSAESYSSSSHWLWSEKLGQWTEAAGVAFARAMVSLITLVICFGGDNENKASPSLCALISVLRNTISISLIISNFQVPFKATLWRVLNHYCLTTLFGIPPYLAPAVIGQEVGKQTSHCFCLNLSALIHGQKIRG